MTPPPGPELDPHELPSGARLYRCALQINPFEYLKRHDKPTEFGSEEEYNDAIVKACIDNDIKVIAITDHYRVKSSKTLAEAALDEGLWVMGGFEAKSKDGVHFLCLFEPYKDSSLESQQEELERVIGNCGITRLDELSPTGSLDSLELIEQSRNWKAMVVAAHVTNDGGLLKTSRGQSRIKVWQSPNLLACAITKPINEEEITFRQILQNKNKDHKRPHPIAIINASDVNSPEDLEKNSASCLIKMSEVSIEAFRQAFLDPESRIRLDRDQLPEKHAELTSMTWEGGFLGKTSVNFNSNLNVLIGGRGTGKSTIIESIRYVLGLAPLGEEAQDAHYNVVRDVLKPGTKVSLLMKLYHPSESSYTIERTVPNPATVRDNTGKILAIPPQDLIPDIQVFGQHEIAELAKSPDKLTRLLERFADHDPSLSRRKIEIRMELERSRRQIVETRHEMETLEERLAALPGLEEMQGRYQRAGLEKLLKEKSLLVREEKLLSISNERLEPFRALHSELVEDLPVDAAYVSNRALDGLPNADILSQLDGVFDTLSVKLAEIGSLLNEALSQADMAIEGIKGRWGERRETINNTYEQILRDLQKSGIDGDEFIQLRRSIEELRPLKDLLESIGNNLKTYESYRHNLILEWEDIKAQEYREIKKAADKISRGLRGRVRVEVEMAKNRNPLEELLREVGGRLTEALDCIRRVEQLSLPQFSQHCREGKESLQSHYGFPSGAAERIAAAGLDLHLRIEEIELSATTHVELNTAMDGEPANWRMLNDLSTGQKATAVLLLLLLDSEAPLVIDQPEDDLDNRFITEGIVPMIREKKPQRQFIFSTHNANIPVLGDAELILGLAASVNAEGQSRIASEHMGSIDSLPVRELVERTLEGGRDAFEMRRSKYGF